ncbi:hypothetical protein BK663_00900 [Pseudomonas lini]|uniref:EAL domain-containing protein n=1 Tax=Pseudomonas lini TaxID=163011 RepID=A0A423J291_9PSED|nr:hypothetical protein BK663_00900 [Pseudomonas lini]
MAFSAGLIFIARARLFRCLGVGAKLRERNADRERLRQAAAVFDCTREHPQRGLVSPAEFIPIAERTGLIAEIDAWIMRQACQQMCQWQVAGVVLSFVAVNISSRLFARRELYQQVAHVLHDTGLDPAYLELEVTESAVMEDPEVALEQMHRLRELGVRLAIDDFGTGYSSPTIG